MFKLNDPLGTPGATKYQPWDQNKNPVQYV